MMKLTGVSMSVLAMAGASLAGCQSFNSATGSNKVVPDEFKVVTKAPLVVPPEFALRPPRPGESRPREVGNASGRKFVFGQDLGTEASAGEQYLIQKAGAVSADPAIRSEVDYDEAGIVRKRSSFVAEVLTFGRAGRNDVDTGTPINLEEEERRLADQDAIDAATGGGEVTIRKGGRGPRIKLPGT